MGVLIWGCGAKCQRFIERKYIDLTYVDGFIDSNLQAGVWKEKKVYRPEEVPMLFEENPNISHIIVTTRQKSVCEEIYKTAIKMNIPDEKLLFVYNIQQITEKTEIHNQSFEPLQYIFPKLFAKVQQEELRSQRTREIVSCGFDLIDSDILIGTAPFSNVGVYLDEYVRYRTFELAANEINKNNIEGAAAEVGVFRGTFAKLINAKFPDRKLYLFDSFESFRCEEYQKELGEKNCEKGFFDDFLNTSVEVVLKNMMYPENCVIRKGFFPESLRQEDFNERFAFVSMDVDFEESTYQCLKYLYPLVTPGGYIFLHDYNNRFLGGVKKAVQRYESDTGVTLKKVPICDEGGTIIILK